MGTDGVRLCTSGCWCGWPKLIQNLRATELLAHYPAKDVTSWLGNSPDVANKHYAMTMQASFDRAVVDGAKIVGVTTVPPNGSKPTTNDDGEVVAGNAPQKNTTKSTTDGAG